MIHAQAARAGKAYDSRVPAALPRSAAFSPPVSAAPVLAHVFPSDYTAFAPKFPAASPDYTAFAPKFPAAPTPAHAAPQKIPAASPDYTAFVSIFCAALSIFFALLLIFSALL